MALAGMAALFALSMAPDIEDKIQNEVSSEMSNLNNDDTLDEWLKESETPYYPIPQTGGYGSRIEPEEAESIPGSDMDIRGKAYIMGTPQEMYNTAFKYPEMTDMYGIKISALNEDEFLDPFLENISEEGDYDKMEVLTTGGREEEGDYIFIGVPLAEWQDQIDFANLKIDKVQG
ncbi:MAG: hypothetical protein ACOCP8_02655 [archaeon]